MKSLEGKESHIRADGSCEVLLDRGTVKEVYENLFGDALLDYNHKQIAKGRTDRTIESYYDHIKADGRKHLSYEMVIGVYSKNGSEISDDIKRQIYVEYLKGFAKRNPSLHLFSICLHNDEANFHCHIAFVPTYISENRGMSLQTGLKKALQSQGFFGTSAKNSEQIQWEKDENLHLEEICKKYNLEVVRQENKKEHLQTDIFKLTKEREKVAEEYEQTIENNRILVKKYNELVNAVNKLCDVIKELQRRKDKMIESELERRHSRYREKSR